MDDLIAASLPHQHARQECRRFERASDPDRPALTPDPTRPRVGVEIRRDLTARHAAPR